MTPFIIGALVGLVAAVVLTFAYYRMRGVPALCTLLGTIFLSLAPRIYYGIAAIQGTESKSADFDYTVPGWSLSPWASIWATPTSATSSRDASF